MWNILEIAQLVLVSEAAYDASEIELEKYEGAGWFSPRRLDNEDVETIEFMVSIYAVF